ncbi:serine hydrolase domain-containing protein [Micromonospora rubida]|uniref:serine hydrolase domain-containing protein n=1 Tax=Micromonospora rubida TaxID=2697657 RepID=UPI001F2A759D|nr:serine hydrolase domain-containing protein [Micromonospora rubida]
MSVHRRAVLSAGFATLTAALAGCRDQAPAGRPTSGPTSAAASPAGRAATGAPTTGPSASPSATAEGRMAQRGPQDHGPLTAVLTRHLAPTSANPDHPAYAGAVALCQIGGTVIARSAVGRALRYGAGPTLLPEAKQVAMRHDSVFDLASITKVYTSILALQQVDRGRFDLASRVVDHLPGFTGAGKDRVTVSMLLTHTSGLPVGAKVTGLPDDAARRAAVLSTPLVGGAVPGKVFRYSSVGLMVLAQLVEKVTGKRLDQVLKSELTGPLGLRDTGFNPKTWLSATDQAARLVATDARSSRGLLRGVVHDDVANHLGGIAGHAGIFSTAADLAVIGQLLLDGGIHNGTRILSEAITRQMLADANAGLPAVDPERPNRTSAHGLGVVLNQPWFMGKLAGPRTFGHTGFTGTSLLVNPDRRMVLVLLTNRAHPNWSWADPDPVRVAVADTLAGPVKR